MTHSTKRSILRWVHILFGLPIIGFIYGPPEEVEQYRQMFQTIFMPGLLLSGLWMWQGHVLRRLFSKGAT